MFITAYRLRCLYLLICTLVLFFWERLEFGMTECVDENKGRGWQ